MRRPRQQQDNSDLARTISRLAAFAEMRAQEGQTSMAARLANAAENRLPDADIVISQSVNKTLVDISAPALISREFGSLNRAADAPVAKALDDVLGS